MTDQYIGEIRMFGGRFAPVDWAFCNGQTLQISDYPPLFALIGTTYGGDGQTTFALPNLQGRLPLHQGQSYVLGQSAGSGQAHDNMMPYLAVSFIIALNGLYPTPN